MCDVIFFLNYALVCKINWRLIRILSIFTHFHLGRRKLWDVIGISPSLFMSSLKVCCKCVKQHLVLIIFAVTIFVNVSTTATQTSWHDVGWKGTCHSSSLNWLRWLLRSVDIVTGSFTLFPSISFLIERFEIIVVRLPMAEMFVCFNLASPFGLLSDFLRSASSRRLLQWGDIEFHSNLLQAFMCYLCAIGCHWSTLSNKL